jgi:hypothetical protein
MTTGEGYLQQMREMAANAKAWRAAHPDKTAKIQFNFPHDMHVIACISEAVKQGAVSVDDNGRELLQALWPWGVASEPTVLMCRVAIEASMADGNKGHYERPS